MKIMKIPPDKYCPWVEESITLLISKLVKIQAINVL